jgi:Fic family protein
MAYNWQLSNWPHFAYNLEDLQPLILAIAQETGEVNGMP